MRLRTAWVLCVALATLAATTAIRIEVLNARAGSYLPRTDWPEDGGNPKWRADPGERGRLERWLRIQAGIPPDQPLSAEQHAAVDAELERGLARNALREVVGGWGLLQYGVVPLGAILAIAERRRARGCTRAGLDAALAIFAASLALMLHRGYFTSLGF
jgi:hypothetical protein